MSKNYRFIVIFLILIIGLLVFFVMSNNSEYNKVCINDNCFNVEIAKSSEERSRGLMYRENLDQNSGMFFIFDEEREYSFWMKNTLIPLDIIWANKDMEIVYIEKNVQPCKKDPCERYTPNKPAKYVLELNAGSADKFNIKIENKLIWEEKVGQ